MRHIATAACAAVLISTVATGCGGPADTPADPAPTAVTTPGGSPTTVPATTAGGPATTASPAGTADPWLLTTDGIGPYRLGERIDSMAPGIFAPSTPIDSANCPDLYSREATGAYAGTLLFVVRHSVLVQIQSAGGDPGVHSAQGDRVGDPWSTVESRHPDGGYLTGAGGARAFTVPVGVRVMMFHVNPIRPDGVGSYLVGLADHSRATFLSGAHC
jgi:hypothetical protein